MKTQRKLELLGSFPPLPCELERQMNGRGAMNFAIFLADGKELYARCYHRYSDGKVCERQRYVFADDGCVRYGIDNGKWSVRKQFREPVFCLASYGYSFDNSYRVINLKAVRNSCMKYSMVEEYGGQLIMEYLKIYCRHPNMEYLIKSGYGRETYTERVTGFWGGTCCLDPNTQINWKSNNLLKMLNLNRTEFAALKGSEKYYSQYICWRERLPKCRPEELLNIAKIFRYDRQTAEHFCKCTGVRLARLARYLNENGIGRFDYRDYLEQCETLGYNLHDTAICMPHDFQAIHERLSAMIKYGQDKEYIRKFNDNMESRRVLGYRSGGLIIRQPYSMDEIAAEGRALNHCVGGYAKRHAAGELHIMFIRNSAEPDKPFYTMEVSKEGKIVQVRGNHNCDPTPEVAELIRQYKSYLSGIFENRKARKSA